MYLASLNMKASRILPVLLIFIFGLIVLPELTYSIDLEMEIAQEQWMLDMLEQEIEYLKDLVEQKNLVKQKQLSQETDLILNLFNEKSQELEIAYQQSDRSLIERKHQEIKYIFKDTDIVLDLYLFYNAIYDYYQRAIPQAREKLIIITDEYPQSSKIRPALSLLQTIYINNEQNREYLELFARYAYLADSSSKYLLGQALFNLREYEEAKLIFEELTEDQIYGFRSQIMLGMILYANFKTEESLDYLEALSRFSDRTTPYYGFLILTLARISGQDGDYQRSLSYYNIFLELDKSSMKDQVFYEIALINKAMGNIDEALNNLNRITSLPERSELYDAAVILFAGIEAQSYGYDYASEIINEVLQANRSYDELLEYQAQLLESMRSEVENYIAYDYPGRRHQFDRYFDQYEAINGLEKTLAKTSLHQEEQIYITLVNEEYIRFLKLIVDIDDVAWRIAALPNDRRVRQIENQINEIDEMRVSLLANRLIHNLKNQRIIVDNEPNRTWSPFSNYIILTEAERLINASFQDAKVLAREIITKENILTERSAELSETEIVDLEQSIKLLYKESEEKWRLVDNSDVQVMMIDEELDRLSELRIGLIDIVEPVSRSFHEMVSQRLRRVNSDSFYASDQTFTFSMEAINRTRSELGLINQQYDYALLDILFQENVRREREYRALMQRLDSSERR